MPNGLLQYPQRFFEGTVGGSLQRTEKSKKRLCMRFTINHFH